ncbi:AI-2E family transporter [Virgibacillus kimchii]
MFKDKKRASILYWLLLAILLFVFLYLFVRLFPLYGRFFAFIWQLFLPFLIAGLIAYLLYPIIVKIEDWNIPRSIAILSIYLLFFGGIGYLIYRVYPATIVQLRDLSEQLPQFISMYQTFINQMYESTSFLPETVHDKMDELILRVESSIDHLLSRLAAGFTRIFDMIIIITVIPVLVFYFLKDYGKWKKLFKKYIPVKHRTNVNNILHGIDKSLGGYIRGQLIVSLFVAVTAFILFEILSLEYALLLAIIMGVTNLIPYFGPIIGAVPAVAIAFTVSLNTVIFVIIAIFVIQLLESNMIAPYIVGRSIAIHPVAIIFALLLGGKISGVIGMVLAVPLLTVLKVIVTHAFAFRNYY